MRSIKVKKLMTYNKYAEISITCVSQLHKAITITTNGQYLVIFPMTD